MKKKTVFKNLIADRTILTQYTDYLQILIDEASWSELRIEMSKALPKPHRGRVPGFKSAEIIHRPDNQTRLNETPWVIVKVEGFDDLTYEWEASLNPSSTTSDLSVVGDIHLASSEPAPINFKWTPNKTLQC